jgi:hypothetical protein
MKRLFLKTAVLLVATFAASTSSAEDWEVTGFISLDTQAFWLDGQYPSQENGLNPTLLLQPEFYWRSDDSQQRISIVGFGRADSADDERSHVDLREAYWGIEGSGWDLTAGVSKIFWGVTESRHLVDVINQTDLVESVDEESKLGQSRSNTRRIRRLDCRSSFLEASGSLHLVSQRYAVCITGDFRKKLQMVIGARG